MRLCSQCERWEEFVLRPDRGPGRSGGQKGSQPWPGPKGCQSAQQGASAHRRQTRGLGGRRSPGRATVGSASGRVGPGLAWEQVQELGAHLCICIQHVRVSGALPRGSVRAWAPQPNTACVESQRKADHTFLGMSSGRRQDTRALLPDSHTSRRLARSGSTRAPPRFCFLECISLAERHSPPLFEL